MGVWEEGGGDLGMGVTYIFVRGRMSVCVMGAFVSGEGCVSFTDKYVGQAVCNSAILKYTHTMTYMGVQYSMHTVIIKEHTYNINCIYYTNNVE